MAARLLMCSLIDAATTTKSAFFFNHPATPEIYPLSLHDALPIFGLVRIADGALRRARLELATTGNDQQEQRQCGRMDERTPGCGAAHPGVLSSILPHCRCSCW